MRVTRLARESCRDGIAPTQASCLARAAPKKFGEVISDFDPTAAGYEAQALAGAAAKPRWEVVPRPSAARAP